MPLYCLCCVHRRLSSGVPISVVLSASHSRTFTNWAWNSLAQRTTNSPSGNSLSPLSLRFDEETPVEMQSHIDEHKGWHTCSCLSCALTLCLLIFLYPIEMCVAKVWSSNSPKCGTSSTPNQLNPSTTTPNASGILHRCATNCGPLCQPLSIFNHHTQPLVYAIFHHISSPKTTMKWLLGDGGWWESKRREWCDIFF